MQNPDFNEKRRNAETNDLIYEGIATHLLIVSFVVIQFLNETNDLIYEGIATLTVLYLLVH
jgi:phage tail sheath gpL-like